MKFYISIDLFFLRLSYQCFTQWFKQLELPCWVWGVFVVWWIRLYLEVRSVFCLFSDHTEWRSKNRCKELPEWCLPCIIYCPWGDQLIGIEDCFNQCYQFFREPCVRMALSLFAFWDRFSFYVLFYLWYRISLFSTSLSGASSCFCFLSILIKVLYHYTWSEEIFVCLFGDF